MACFHPIKAWQRSDGQIVFVERGNIFRALQLPCGHCVGCHYVRARSWAIRCVHEAQLHKSNSFITLTYNNKYCKLSLDYRDFQLFMKRLRKYNNSNVRFFMCGEYGSLLQRPHFHAILFGVSFPNLQSIGKDLYTSSTLERLWPYGFSSVGQVTAASAGYVARYSCKKVYGQKAVFRYRRVLADTGETVQVRPEFGHMSLKPGIGYGWFQRYWKDVYAARDGVVLDGRTLPSPRYYDDLLRRSAPVLMEDKDYTRYISSAKFLEDCTPERLVVREICAKARSDRMKRRLE